MSRYEDVDQVDLIPGIFLLIYYEWPVGTRVEAGGPQVIVGPERFLEFVESLADELVELRSTGSRLAFMQPSQRRLVSVVLCPGFGVWF